jgi:hypothetical protein
MLTDLQGTYVDSRGNKVSKETLGARHLLDGDPLHWPQILQEIPPLSSILQWIAAGGALEKLSPKTLEELKKTDAYFLNQGLPPPFAPYLQVQPRPLPIPFPKSLAVFLHQQSTDLSLPTSTLGWQAASLKELDRCLRGLQEAAAMLGSESPKLPTRIRNKLHAIQEVRWKRVNLDTMIDETFLLEDQRSDVAHWLLPKTLALQAGLYAAGRSLESEPATRKQVARILELFLAAGSGGEKHPTISPRVLLLSHLFRYPASWLLTESGIGPWQRWIHLQQARHRVSGVYLPVPSSEAPPP